MFSQLFSLGPGHWNSLAIQLIESIVTERTVATGNYILPFSTEHIGAVASLTGRVGFPERSFYNHYALSKAIAQ